MAATNARGSPRPARADGRPWPGLIGVDQEGGIVARLGAPLTEWPTPMSYGAAGQCGARPRTPAGPWRPSSRRWASTWTSRRTRTSPSAPRIRPSARGPCPGTRTRQGAGRGVFAGDAGGRRPARRRSISRATAPSPLTRTRTCRCSPPASRSSRPATGSRSGPPSPPACPMVMTGHIAVPALEPGVPASLSAPDVRRAAGHGLQGRGRDRRPEHGCGPAAILRAARPPRRRSPPARTCC